jgi:hypothetical protein
VSLPDSEFIRFYFDLALALGFISIEELQVAREALEREIARRAATMANIDDVAELNRLAERMQHATEAQERLEARLPLSYAIGRKRPKPCHFDHHRRSVQRVASDALPPAFPGA